jgi:hypothetical protein
MEKKNQYQILVDKYIEKNIDFFKSFLIKFDNIDEDIDRASIKITNPVLKDDYLYELKECLDEKMKLISVDELYFYSPDMIGKQYKITPSAPEYAIEFQLDLTVEEDKQFKFDLEFPIKMNKSFFTIHEVADELKKIQKYCPMGLNVKYDKKTFMTNDTQKI